MFCDFNFLILHIFSHYVHCTYTFVQKCILWSVYTRGKQFNLHVVKITATTNICGGCALWSCLMPVYCL